MTLIRWRTVTSFRSPRTELTLIGHDIESMRMTVVRTKQSQRNARYDNDQGNNNRYPVQITGYIGVVTYICVQQEIQRKGHDGHDCGNGRHGDTQCQVRVEKRAPPAPSISETIQKVVTKGPETEFFSVLFLPVGVGSSRTARYHQQSDSKTRFQLQQFYRHKPKEWQ